MREDDVRALRDSGWTDRAISDIVHVASNLNYIHRVAEGLGLGLEAGMPPQPA